MISREEAIKKLKEFWGTNKLVFQAEFHIPSTPLREGTKPFGYFRNIRFNGELLEYPLENSQSNEKRISIYQIIKDDLTDKEQYEVTLDLAKDDYRKKNPFQLIVKHFKKLDVEIEQIDVSLRNTITEIFNENININSPYQVVNLANSVESLATDIYSEDKRFVYELIQNADDAALNEESELSIEILNNYVVISHNGAPFNSRDIRGLCSIGLGTKTNDSTKTGYKGIGFKSVFGQPEGIVYVKTENTLFRFDRDYARKKGWNSKWGNQYEWEQKNGVVFQCPWQMMPILTNSVNDKELDAVLNNEKYNVKTAIKINNSEQIFNNINVFFSDAKFLLFLRKITLVNLIFKNNKIELQKRKNNENDSIVTLLKNQQTQSNWYVKNWIHSIPTKIQTELKSDPKTPKKIQSMEKTEISFALEVDQSYTAIKLIEEGLSPLYSYLPTTVKEYNLPFIVNCNFLLDASREKIHKDRKWNEWLFQVIGYKTVELASELLAKDVFASTYLSILRNGFYSETDNLRAKTNEGIKIGLDKFPIISNREKELSLLKEIAFDSFKLASVNSELNDIFSDFLNSIQKDQKFLGKNIIEIDEFNRIALKLKPFIITDDHLQEFFSSKYLNKLLTTESNYNLLSFIRPFEQNDKSGKWFVICINNKLIINDKGKPDFIKKVCFPMEIGQEESEEYKNVLINSTVYEQIKNDEELVKWLEKLGVTEPNSLAYLEKEIIGEFPKSITINNYKEITQFIFKLYKEKRLADNHFNDLQELPIKTNKGFFKANQCILSTLYNPTLDFSDTLPSEAYISEDYLEISNAQELKKFFKSINVLDDVEFNTSLKKISTELPRNYVLECNNFAKDEHAYPHLIGVYYVNTPATNVPYQIQNFSFLEKTTNEAFSKLFWDRLLTKFVFYKEKEGISQPNYCPSRKFTIYNIGNGHYLSTLDNMSWGWYPSNSTKIPSFIFWFIQNVKCIPTNLGLSLANETFVNTDYIKELSGDYLPVINTNTIVINDWLKFIPLKQKLSIDDLLNVLDKIAISTSQKGYLEKDNEKRIGLIYNELISRINVSTEKTIEIIKKWGNNHLIISSLKNAVNSEKLVYINISGFENSPLGTETILIPKNVDTNVNSFEELLKAFGIKIINSFSYQATNPQNFYDLKIKLLELIGPVCLLLKNKMVLNDLDKSLYDRLQKISQTSFVKCENIKPIFTYESVEIEGKSVLFYNDDSNNKFLISENWKNPSVILNISYHLSKLLSAVRLEKEIMMMLNMSVPQINDYLIGLGIEIEEHNSSTFSKKISDLIKELENKSAVQLSPKILTSPSDLNKTNQIEKNQKEEEKEDHENNEDNDINTDTNNSQKSFIKEVEDFIADELEGTEWSQHIIELKELLQLDTAPGEQKKKIYNLLAKLKLAKIRNIQFERVDESDRQFNYLEGNGEKYIVHSARGSFAYISPIEILKMRDEGFMMALDFGNKTPIKIYHQAEEVLSLNTNHLLLYQNEKTIEELFFFCESNQSANKRLLIIDKDHANNKSKELLKLMIPDEDY